MSVVSWGQAVIPYYAYCALAEPLRLFDWLLKMMNVWNMMEHLAFLTALSDLRRAPLPSTSPRPVITINTNTPRAILLFFIFFHKPSKTLTSARPGSCPARRSLTGSHRMYFFPSCFALFWPGLKEPVHFCPCG